MILLFGERLVVIFQDSEGGFGDFGVEELLVHGSDEINVPDQISRGHPVLIDDRLDFVIGETEAKEAGGSGKA